jgi:hypothetical protein
MHQVKEQRMNHSLIVLGVVGEVEEKVELGPPSLDSFVVSLPLCTTNEGTCETMFKQKETNKLLSNDEKSVKRGL